MRNLYCNVEALRKQVFAAVAKLAYEGGDYCSRMEKLPYEIIPGEVGTRPIGNPFFWSGPSLVSASGWPWVCRCGT